MTSISLGFLLDPKTRKASETWMESGSSVRFGTKKQIRNEKKYYVDDTYSKFFKEKMNNVEFMKIPMMAMISLIHDSIKDNGYDKQTPEFEFLRHLRNAVSHGNRFTFRNNEPKRPAYYDEFILDVNINGMENVIFDFIHFEDILNLINYIKNDL
ncbi:hypothetical protein [Flavobacterium swingsii]|nr:hypothetical protein [Flavobacterium swingsii]